MSPAPAIARTPRPVPRTLGLVVVLAAALVATLVGSSAAPAGAAGPEGPPVTDETREVMFVGNN